MNVSRRVRLQAWLMNVIYVRATWPRLSLATVTTNSPLNFVHLISIGVLVHLPSFLSLSLLSLIFVIYTLSLNSRLCTRPSST